MMAACFGCTPASRCMMVTFVYLQGIVIETLSFVLYLCDGVKDQRQYALKYII